MKTGACISIGMITCAAFSMSGCATRPHAEPPPMADATPAPEPATDPAQNQQQKMVLATSKLVFDTIVFDLNETELSPDGMATTDELIAALKEHPDVTVVIHGHTCNLGPAQVNRTLSARRADTVKRYMVEHGIDPARLTTKANGESKPAVPNEDLSYRKFNRRVEFDTTFPFVCELVPAE